MGRPKHEYTEVALVIALQAGGGQVKVNSNSALAHVHETAHWHTCMKHFCNTIHSYTHHTFTHSPFICTLAIHMHTLICRLSHTYLLLSWTHTIGRLGKAHACLCMCVGGRSDIKLQERDNARVCQRPSLPEIWSLKMASPFWLHYKH
jgi:hypothetical protein